MKKSWFLAILVFLQMALTAQLYAQAINKKITFGGNGITLKAAFNQIEKLAGVTISYNNSTFNDKRTITVSRAERTLQETLTLVLRGTNFTFRPSSNNILLVALSTNNVVIRGNVVDDDDSQPLIGVTISNNDKRTLALTNTTGAFAVNVPAGTEVTIGYIGYTAQKFTFTANQNNVAVRLNRGSSQLDEVVVTALGIKREEKALGYAITKVKGEDLTNALSNNWTDALSGKVAGLNLIRSNGGPAGSTSIILRGESNLSGDNDALIVIDGVVINGGSGRRTGSGNNAYLDTESPVDFGSGLNDINPEDIEDITVLKGPSAAALYGQRGANGALIITTKSGKSRKGIGVTINSNTAFEQISRWPDYQYEYGQGDGTANYYSFGATADGASTRSTSSAWGPKFDGQSYFQYDPVTRTGGTTRTPWVAYPNARKDFFETGKTFTNAVTLDGSSDKTSVRFSATNVKNNWILPNTGYTRNSVALSATQKTTDKLQISAKVNYTNKGSDNLPATGYNNQALMYWNMFWVPNGNLDWLKNYWLPGKENINQSYPFSSFPDNPYLISYEMLNKSNRNDVVGNIQATYNFTKELSLMVRTAMTMSYDQRSQQRPYDTEKFRKGMYRTQDIFSQEINNDFLLRYKKKINKEFTLDASGGGSMLANNYNRNDIRADSLLYPGVYSLANSAGVIVTLPYKSKYKINSFYGLLALSYKDYLFADFSARNDWSSVLSSAISTNNVSFFYPSVNLSAVVSDMFKLPSFVTYAKLRGTYAQVGSGLTTPYLTTQGYSKPTTPFPGGLQNSTRVANLDLKPLRTTSMEIGTDLKFFNSRVGLGVTLYRSNTHDQILENTGIDPASGFLTSIVNAGNVRNEGIEIEANGTPFKSKNGFNWNVYTTFSSNRNKVLSLPQDQPVVLQGGPANRGLVTAKVGGSMGDMYGIGYQRSPDGQIIYENGLPKQTDTNIYIGNTMPKWRASIGNQFRYKQFSMSFLVDGQYGAVGYSLTSAVLAESGKTKNTLPGRYNGIIGNGVIRNADGTFRPNDVVAYDVADYYTAHYGRDNVEGTTYSTDFIKLREARFDYSFSPKLAARLGLQRVTLGVYGRDLLIITKWPGFDPEFGTLTQNAQGSAVIARGFELGQLPTTRTFGFNLTLGF